MSAYSFKRRFMAPIQLGLGSVPVTSVPPLTTPKRQTIRAGTVVDDRHVSPKGRKGARVGGELQLYVDMRTKHCKLLGRARCVSVGAITIWIGSKPDISIQVPDVGLLSWRQIRDFALGDGFADQHDMAAFWMEVHGPGKFEGVLIKWEPIE